MNCHLQTWGDLQHEYFGWSIALLAHDEEISKQPIELGGFTRIAPKITLTGKPPN